jgi:benzoate membrane transport protein
VGGTSQPVVAGLVAALVGFAGAFTVVLAGLRGAGRHAEQAASGLLALCVTMGSARSSSACGRGCRWPSPGRRRARAARLSGPPDGGWPAAVGAFVVCGVLLVLTASGGPLGRAIAAIPAPLAAAMLAGVLLPLCLAPPARWPSCRGRASGGPRVGGAVAHRAALGGAGALVAAAVVVPADPAGPAPSARDLVPVVQLTAPVFEAAPSSGSRCRSSSSPWPPRTCRG